MDTNVVLYLLNGDRTIAEIIDGKQIYVSFITELELLGYQGITKSEQVGIKDFLKDCSVVNITEQIKEAAIKIRQSQKIKLPDSIIAGTSQYLNVTLLTADNDFKKVEGIDTLIYEI